MHYKIHVSILAQVLGLIFALTCYNVLYVSQYGKTNGIHTHTRKQM